MRLYSTIPSAVARAFTSFSTTATPITGLSITGKVTRLFSDSKTLYFKLDECTWSKRQYVSRMFTHFLKIKPDEAKQICNSHKLLLYNDIIQQAHSGAFHLMPLGLRALEKLVRVIDEEMLAIDAEKISMPCLTTGELWKKSGRWKTMGDELLRLTDRHDADLCLGPTHEEAVTDLIASYSTSISYKRLPIMLYQITRKFRDEMAPKYGLLRGREFDMKDMYTFDMSEDTAMQTYDKVCEAYVIILTRLGLKHVKVAADTGAIGGTLSHEFHLPASAGEDTLYICEKCQDGWNKDMIDVNKLDAHRCSRPDCVPDLKETAGIEVGHAFFLGRKYSQTFNATYRDEQGKPQILEMGCYGLGVSRLLQAAVEVLSTDKRIRWPSVIAPYQVCVIPQKEGYGSATFNRISDEVSDLLTSDSRLAGEVIIDDRIKMTVGKRMYEANDKGFPFVIIVGRKSLDDPSLLEVMNVYKDTTQFMTKDQLIDYIHSDDDDDDDGV